MSFALRIETDNDAFRGPDCTADRHGEAEEISRILHRLASERPYLLRNKGPLVDVNGNTVGTWEMRP